MTTIVFLRSPCDSSSENGARHILLDDLNDEVSRDYRIVAIPVTVMIDDKGRAVFRHLGFEDSMVPRLKKEIDTLLAWRGAA